MISPEHGPNARLLRVLRVTAVFIGAATVVFLFIIDGWRTDNMFLVPDLILAAALIAAALLGRRQAVVALLLGFAFAAGVLSTATMSYLIRGQLLSGAIVAFVIASAAALLLLAGMWRARVPGA
jgi:hypothetical protein